jgi:flavin reductase (DIM6/NTAB) family NADH-FMN oxidoreductase RutF
VVETTEKIRLRVDSKIAYRLFYPQVPLIICSKFRAEIAAMPAVSCVSVSNKPPLLALAIFRISRTGSIIKKSRRFSINWINFRNQKLRKSVVDLAKSGAAEQPDKLKANRVSYRLEKDIPILSDNVAYALCELSRMVRTGDHELFVAKVKDARASNEFRDYWKFKTYKPILYLGSERGKPFTTLKL